MLHPLARPGTALALAAVLAVLPSAALADAQPVNDDVDGATMITVPFDGDQDTSGATAAADDPQSCWDGYTVWYALRAPVDGTVRSTVFATSFNSDTGGQVGADSGVAVFTGTPGALVEQGCDLKAVFEGAGSVDVAVTAGQRLWIAAGSRLTRGPRTLGLDVRYLASPRATVHRTGTVTRDGRASLAVRLRCTVAAQVQLTLGLTQSGGRSGTVVVPSVRCTTAGRTVHVDVPSATGVLRPGRARYDLEVATGDAPPVTRSGCVQLRRR